MGTWGSAMFENDAAQDWMGELLEEGQYHLIGRVLSTVTEGSTESDDCSAALAAAEVVAAARGWPVRGFPRELKEWIKTFDYRPTEGAQSLAMKAVHQVFDDSELAELWKENPKEEKKWRKGLQDLIERLGKSALERGALQKPKKTAPTGVKEAIKRLKGPNAYIQMTPAGHAKYVHLESEVDDETLAACLPFVSRTKVLRIGSGGMTATPKSSPASDAAFESLDQFKVLQEMHLENSQITDATLARLSNLTKLRVLGLTATRITDAGIEHLRKLTALESLSLGLTAITDASLTHLTGMKDLKKLDLFKTSVTDDGLKHLAGLINLADLDLRYTKITGAGLKHLAKLTNMWLLELEHTLIDDEGVAHLSKMTKLARLTIRGKRLSDNAIKTIGKLTALQGLVIENTQITDESLQVLSKLPALEVIHLAGTGVSTEGARWLRKTCPKLMVLGKDK